MKTRTPVDYRSAITGRFVTKEYADHHQAITIAEHNRQAKPTTEKK